jgi:hypothetical protein
MSSRKMTQARKIELDGDNAGTSESLVDISLIDETIRLSPEERLLQNDRMIATIMELRDAFRSK